MMDKRSASRIVILSLSAVLVYTKLPTDNPVFPPERMAMNFTLQGTSPDCQAKPLQAKTDVLNPRYEAAWHGICKDSHGYSSNVLIGYTSEQRGDQRRLVALADYLDGPSVWKQTSGHTTLTIGGDSQDRRVFRAGSTHLQTRSGETISVLYWYEMGGQGYGDEYRYRTALFWHKLMKRPTNGALVVISTPVHAGYEAAILAAQVDVAKFVHQRVLMQIPIL